MKKSSKIILIASGALTVCILAAMHIFLLPQIQAAAGGIACFDMQSFGYTLETATAFLTQLTDAGRNLYLYALVPLDFVFLLVYTVFFSLALRALFSTNRFLWAPLTLSVADIIENICTILMLRTGDAASVAAFASKVTLCKTLLMYAVFVLILIGLIRFLVKKKRRTADVDADAV